MRAHRIDVAATSDFEKGFIKAEVCSYDDYKALTTKPSDAEVKAAGKYRQEGKTYKLLDGDIVHFQVLPPASAYFSALLWLCSARALP
jgi:obg-like ATPase 1